MVGTAVSPALITFDVATTYSFGKLAVGASADASLSLTNNGSVTATTIADGVGLSVPFTFKGGTYPGTGGTCGTSLNVGSSCLVVVTFAPTATGSPSASAKLTYFDGANSQIATRTVTGTGATAAVLTLSDGPTYNYGTYAVGRCRAKNIYFNELRRRARVFDHVVVYFE